MKKIAIMFLFFLLLVGCPKKEVSEEKLYLAKVGAAKITQEDFDKDFDALPPYAQKMFEDAEGRERFLDELIKKELLYQEALKQGYDAKPEFQEKLQEFKKLTLISELFGDEILSKTQVSEEEIKDFYEKNKEDFTPVGQIRAQHILVRTEDEADDVLERLKKGERFEDLAKAVSIDKASAKKGGDLGYFSMGQMVPEFEKAAAELEVGTLSSPVKTPFGYHIIKVLDKKEGASVEFAQVKDMIMQKLSADKQKEVFDTYIAGLKNTYKIEINKEALAGTSEKTEEGRIPEPSLEQPETPKTEEPEPLEKEKTGGSETESGKEEQQK